MNYDGGHFRFRSGWRSKLVEGSTEKERRSRALREVEVRLDFQEPAPRETHRDTRDRPAVTTGVAPMSSGKQRRVRGARGSGCVS